MKIQSIQKVIKIGSSKGVTIPAKDLKYANLDVGDDVEVEIRPVGSSDSVKYSEISKAYAEFKQQYSETLKNLADR
jgi:antitoxin component of MazEF toxin-antitoxin module